ncbi:hypothetical protein BOX15_Mlig023251g7 [Paramuricea clavata]|uniref:Uncharacterized protein n=1 Tax=Paramuricea clavata TaxID=317549 RepID=A0A7D9J6G0_PARCT|nr:hypothetical protein BOX15_Mlig023251g7 [Paramuricea clavata]
MYHSGNGIHQRFRNPPTSNEHGIVSKVSEVKSFLGLINFLARFTPNLATEAEPLRRLTRSGNKWIWGPDQQKSFQGLKNSISRASCLVFFDKDRQTELRVDASPVGLGAILCQIQGDGTSRPVAYASRSLSDVEREALAVKFGCLKFDHYLSGDPDFTIITDHKPLLGLYKPGSHLLHPTLPRAHVNPSEHADTRMINAITTASLPRACIIEQVREATAKDAKLQTVLKSLQSGTWNKDLGLFFSHRNEVSFSDGVLLRNNRIVIPRSLQQRVLELANQGHQGVAKTKARLRTKVWWPGMSTEAETFVKRYQPCLVATEPTKPSFTPLKPTTLPKAAWLLIGMDFVGPFPTGENLLVLVDYYSRYPEVEIMKHITTAALEPRLRRIFARYGVPQEIVTDNAKTFRSSRFSNLMREFGIKHKKITPRYPRVNGEAERSTAHDANNKQKGKCYHDIKKKVQPSSIKVGDQVLIRSEKKGKVALPWRASTFRVTAVKGDSILIDDGNHRLMRHSTAVKKVPITVTTAPDVATTPPETIVAQRPRRSIKRQPDYYGYSSTA